MSKLLLINYSDTNSEMEKVKHLLSFEGNVKIIEGSKDFVKASLEDSPKDMQYVLIERMARPVKTITKTTVGPTGNVRIQYSDGSSEIRSDDNLENQKFEGPGDADAEYEGVPFPSAWTEEDGPEDEPEDEADDSMRHWVDDEDEEEPEDEN